MSEPTRSDDQVAEVVLRRYAESPDQGVVALTRVLARAVRDDHVALDLDEPVEGLDQSRRDVLEALRAQPRLAQFAGSPDLLAPEGPPLVVVDERFVYVRRLARAEQRVARALVDARTVAVPGPGGLDAAVLERALAEVDVELAREGTPSAALAEVARRALTRSISFVTGGPGTGKTWIVAQVLRVLDRALADAGDGPLVHVAVAAPTGKAARRLGATIDRLAGDFERLVRDREREGSIHRLLGLHPGRVEAPGALHHDVVIVDEVSMADLDLLDALVRACSSDPNRPTHLILVGDPHQLASVNVGAVLADVTDPAAGLDELISRLTTVHRTEHRALLDLAAAVNDGDAARVASLLRAGGPVTHRVDVTDATTAATVVAHAEAVAESAAAGDAALALDRLARLVALAGNREGPGSVAWWNAYVGSHLRRRFPTQGGERFSVGEPVLVTRNQRALGVSNGDLGVVVARGSQRVIAFDAGRELALSGVGFLESAWAMTIHKSQGSEFDHVVVSLPRAESALVTRELLYTALTRARQGVTLLGEDEAIARALATPVSRVSGLTHRLAAWPDEL